jgi:EAL domain-containing protein (putative c-di-GMP-specific phosphodiesterase class I)
MTSARANACAFAKGASTAEGVETVDQLDWLRAEGCNEVQGFLAARPAGEVEGLLSKFGARASRAA